MSELSRTRIVPLTTNADTRGVLTAAEACGEIPFEIQRIFYVYRVQPPYERGGHAHPHTEQLLIAVSGSLTIDVMDPTTKKTYHLDDPGVGLYVPAMLWTRLYAFSPDAVCLAAASSHYVPGDVIRDWDQYVRLATGQRSFEVPSAPGKG